MTVADRIAEFLAEKGITHAFGIIGAGNASLFDAIARLGKTKIVCVHHESAAAMAATYFGRTRGSCGVALVTTGAGSSNAITGAIAANMDSVPVLVISGNEPNRYISADTRIIGVQGYRTARVAADCCKAVMCAWGPTDTMVALNNMYQSAITPRAGAAWLDIPRDKFNAVG